MRANAASLEQMSRHVDVLASWLMLLAGMAGVANGMNSSLPLMATMSGTHCLVSSNGVFALGFFKSTTTSGKVGFGIWYENLPSQGFRTVPRTVVWMPQRDLKLSTGAYLQLGGDGTLALFDKDNGALVWSSGNTPTQANLLTLQDNGNLELRDATTANVLWQSFDTPTDTLLPGQALHATHNRSLIAWRDAGDWSEGYYFCTWLPVNGTRALTLSWNGNSIPSWNRFSWSTTSVTVDSNTTYYPYLIDSPVSDSIHFNGSLYAGNGSSQRLLMSSTSPAVGPLRRATLDRDGGLRLYSWTMGTSTSWSIENNWAEDPCQAFAECGPYGFCSPDPESPAYLGQCSCPQGFEYIDRKDETKGCKQKVELPECPVTTTVKMMKVGDLDYPFVNRLYNNYTVPNETECIGLCLNDCQCAGAVFGQSEGRCFVKSAPLFNGGYPQAFGNHSVFLKIMIAPPETVQKKVSGLIFGLVVPVVGSGLGFLVWWCWTRRRQRLHYCEPLFAEFGPRKYTLRELSAATRNFRELIGRGGMGSVYKGVLRPAGFVVAVKRIQHESGGGEQGFLAEASSISQIRHRNLMQLKGWCIEDGTFLLVYDYMPNGSLDQWLYNNNSNHPRGERKRKELMWSLRYSILTGVAAALAYLHEDWQQCVLHRDIKSSNVLLDADFNAHLGDFGLARLIDHEKLEKTTLMAGTLGYMAPEILFTGKATKDTDVYSFGVLVLEVVCGKKPADTCDHEFQDAILLHHVWRAKEANDLLSAVDPCLRIAPGNNHAAFRDSETASLNHEPARGDCEDDVMDFEGALVRRIAEELAREHDEQARVLKLGLLCCSPNPSARPSMRLVHQILTGDVAIPPLPDSHQLMRLDAMSMIYRNLEPVPLSPTSPDAPPPPPPARGQHSYNLMICPLKQDAICMDPHSNIARTSELLTS